jgi:hypothetical protein
MRSDVRERIMAVRYLNAISTAGDRVRLMIEDEEAEQAATIDLAVDEARRLAAALLFAADAAFSGRKVGDGSHRTLRIYDGEELVFEIDVDAVDGNARRDLKLLRGPRS